jgi:hypothetical protein
MAPFPHPAHRTGRADFPHLRAMVQLTVFARQIHTNPSTFVLEVRIQVNARNASINTSPTVRVCPEDAARRLGWPGFIFALPAQGREGAMERRASHCLGQRYPTSPPVLSAIGAAPHDAAPRGSRLGATAPATVIPAAPYPTTRHQSLGGSLGSASVGGAGPCPMLVASPSTRPH